MFKVVTEDTVIEAIVPTTVSLLCFLLLSFVAHCTAHHRIDYVTRLLPARSLQYIEVES